MKNVTKKIAKFKQKKVIKITTFSFLGLLILFFISFGVYSVIFSNRVYANQYLGSAKLSHNTKDQIKEIIDDGSRQYLNNKITLNYEGDSPKSYLIEPADIGLKYDLDATQEQVWNSGRDKGAFSNFWFQLKSLFVKTNHSYVYSIDETSLNKKIADIAKELDQPEKDYSISYKNGEFVLNTDQKDGRRIDQEEIIKTIKSSIATAGNSQIAFNTKDFHPQITQASAQGALNKANQIIAGGNLTLKYGDQNFVADVDTIGGMIKGSPNGNNLDLLLDREWTAAFVASIAKTIDKTPENAKLSVVNGQVVVTTGAIIGQSLDQDQTIVDIGNSLFNRIEGNAVKADSNTITLKVKTKSPEVGNDAISNLGISELVGTGTTDFRNSPSNRVHNIQVGASSLNGILLKPGDTFSTLGHLGDIDAAHGYLPELVIKDNKTVPDYGGGLCQVSTTLFRAAMNAGLNITERQNHSYRVSYYEPPIGMDATIYDPSPDFKFVNNYDHYLLIQSRIDGTKITFDIYGTKDSRVVSISTPETYDVVNPPAPIMVNTDSLPQGTKKLTDKAHQGITAKFTYSVTRDGQTLQNKTFISKYVALPEKWLVGTGAAAPTCTDGIQNGDESGVDCGGSCPNTCPAN